MKTPEILIADKLGGKNISTSITVTNRTPMEGELNRVTGIVAGRVVSLIERPSPLSHPYEEKRQRLEDAGFKVVPSIRVSSRIIGSRKMRTVLVTDMKADGSKLYGQDFGSEESRPAINSLFLDLTSPEHVERIKEKGREYVELANRLGILLPIDPSGAFTLQVRPNGSWDWVILDPILTEFDDKSIMRGLEDLPAKLGMDYDTFLSYIITDNNEKGLQASLNRVNSIRAFLSR